MDPRREEALDAIDVLEIESMMKSPGWKLYAERLAGMLELARHDCERPGEATLYHQGRAASLRAVIGLPALLLDEARENANARKRRG